MIESAIQQAGDNLRQTQVHQTQHLAGLLTFAGQIALAIRMYTAYNQSGSGLEEFAPKDVMFLSDTLVNFEFLGEYVAAGDSKKVVGLCNKLGPTLTGYIGQPAFARNPRMI